MSNEELISSIISKCNKAFSSTERANFESRWAKQAEFCWTQQNANFNGSSTPGEVKTNNVMDSTAIQANNDLASAMHFALTNPNQKWHKIRFSDDTLLNDDQATEWLEKVNNIIMREIAESNFHAQMGSAYPSLTALGTMAILHEQNSDDNGLFKSFRFQALHLSEIAFSENYMGEVDVLYRKYCMTARQIVEKYEKASSAVLEALEKDPEREFEIIQCIQPREKKKVRYNSTGLALPKERPFASYVIERKSNFLLDESGYYEFPVHIARWSKVPGEVYGRGPAEVALPDVMTLNETKNILLTAGGMAALPPFITTQRNIVGQLNWERNSIINVRNIKHIDQFAPKTRPELAQLNVQDMRNSIRSIFHIDKLMLPPRTETGEMSAYEVSQRLEQMQRILGPTTSRQEYEFLNPLTVRNFKMLLRAGRLPEMPESLRQLGVDVDIIFVNPLTRSQRIDEVESTLAWIGNLANVMQVTGDPAPADWIDSDMLSKHFADIRMVPASVLASEEAVAQKREQRAKQQQMEQMMNAGVAAADMSSKMGK